VKKSDTPCLIVRPCAIYGAKDTHNSYGPNRFLRTALAERTITLFGEGEEKRDHVSIRDLTRLILLGLGQQSEGVLNVASGTATSFMDVAQTIAGLMADAIKIDCKPRATPITHRHFDTTATMKAFPSFRYTPLAEGLRLMRTEMMGAYDASARKTNAAQPDRGVAAKSLAG